MKQAHKNIINGKPKAFTKRQKIDVRPSAVQKFNKPIISDRTEETPPITINTTRTDCCCEPLIYNCENVGCASHPH